MERRRSLAAIFVLCALWLGALAPTHADQPTPLASPVPSASPSPEMPGGAAPESNPFPSPSTTEPALGRYGYVAAGYLGGSANGGQIPPTPGSTSTPTSFPSSQSSGFFVDLLGRLGPSYLAQIMYDNVNVRGGDNPLVSYAQGRVAFEPASSHAAFGLGYVSIQRSTSNANMNAFGLGVSLLPDLRGGLWPYASVYVYPHVQHSGVGATFTSADAGLIFAPRKRGGLFFSLGGSLRSGLPADTSPSSFTGLRAGIGTAF